MDIGDNAMAAATTTMKDEAVDAVYRKVSWRIVPFLMLCYGVAFLDRINIGYAQLQMKQTLPFGDAVYGFGAGIFFVGYFLFEVPSNLMLQKIGARLTLLRIMFIWGIVAALMAFVQTPTQFYVARFLLGVFEAGFFPGIILYFTYWYPSGRRGQMIALFMSATAISSVIAGPLCGAIMKYANDFGGLHGWQWLFILEGLPAAVLGVVAFVYLQDRPEDAHWLTSDEKALLRYELDHDEKDVVGAGHTGLGQLFADPKVYWLALAYFLLLGATYTMVFWVPTLIRSWGVNDLLMVGICAAIPQFFGIIGTVWIGRHSDRHRERRWHYVACVVAAATGMGVIVLAGGGLVPSMVGLTIAGVGWIAATPLFFTTTTEYLSKASAAGGIALISSLGNHGPAAGPSATGWITVQTGSSTISMLLVMSCYVLSGAILLAVVQAAKAHGEPQLAAAPR
jgi:sugar phosphate permease